MKNKGFGGWAGYQPVHMDCSHLRLAAVVVVVVVVVDVVVVVVERRELETRS
jgi:hypothetical protein